MRCGITSFYVTYRLTCSPGLLHFLMTSTWTKLKTSLSALYVSLTCLSFPSTAGRYVPHVRNDVPPGHGAAAGPPHSRRGRSDAGPVEAAFRRSVNTTPLRLKPEQCRNAALKIVTGL